MIARLRGKVCEKKEHAVLLEVGGVYYDVQVPSSVLRRIDTAVDVRGEVILTVHHYLQVGPSSALPVLVGFLNDLEKDFFLQFISVSGIGVKAAVRALDRSIADIAAAIDAGDAAFLKSLPGIGPQKARDIIAKLQGKVSRFGLIPDARIAPQVSAGAVLVEEAVAVLLQLQYKKSEAEEMVRRAMEHSTLKGSAEPSVEEILNVIYSSSRGRDERKS